MKPLLDSRYLIDGVLNELTPRQLLGGCAPQDGNSRIADESIEPSAGPDAFHPTEIDSCLSSLENLSRVFPLAYPETYSRNAVSAALLDAMWRRGSFRSGDLSLSVKWKWSGRRVGSMAAFYRSVEAVAEYADLLGVSIRDYSAGGSREDSLDVKAVLSGIHREGELFPEEPFKSSNPVMRSSRISASLAPDPQSWLIYIPFDTAEYRLGGSLLAQACRCGGIAPQTGDADYFLDCYEVVRELVEDGVALSGATVCEGGLLRAVKSMTGNLTGISLDVSELLNATGERDIVRVLFAEIPGALIQIRDSDFDYVDAELLLQDVAYFPLGHPSEGAPLRVRSSVRTGIQKILDSLIQNHCTEGED